MSSTEDKAYAIMRELDVDYVLVIFGGLTGYSSDGKKLYMTDPFDEDTLLNNCNSKTNCNIIQQPFTNAQH